MTPRTRKHLATATLIWVIASVVGVLIVFALAFLPPDWNPLPPTASSQAVEVDGILKLFTVLSVPVFLGVIIFAGYAVFTFRGSGPDADGARITGNTPFQIVWVIVSIALVAFLLFEGITALHNVEAAPGADALQVNVEGEQWLWDYSYPQYNNISGTTLVLPVNRPVVFSITSYDVQHSFWIPAFAIKQDAVPGETTSISATPTQIGTYVVRCAELCGLYHSYMDTPVQVVSGHDFDAWVAAQPLPPAPLTPSAQPSPSPVPSASDTPSATATETPTATSSPTP